MKTLVLLLALSVLLVAADVFEDDVMEDFESRDEDFDKEDTVDVEEAEDDAIVARDEDRVMALRRITCKTPGMNVVGNGLCGGMTQCKCSTYRNGRKYYYCC